jgi:hypothetical protein
MSGFVVGQRVKRINYNFSSVKIGDICIVSKCYPSIFKIEGSNCLFSMENFKTVIQSINDVIPGMTLTHRGEQIQVLTANTAGVSFVYINDTFNTTGFARYIDEFEEYESKLNKEKTAIKKEYEVIESFNLYDIFYKRNNATSLHEFNNFFEDLLKELQERFGNYTKFFNIEDIEPVHILSNNILLLEQLGLIREKQKGIILKPGMKLIDNYGSIFTVVDSGDGISWNGISLLAEESLSVYSMGAVYDKDIALCALNELEGNNFELVEE